MLSTRTVLRRDVANSDYFIEKQYAVKERLEPFRLLALTGRPDAILRRSHEGVP